MTLLWTERFFPQSFDKFVGNSEVLESVKRWAAGWEKGKKQQPLLFFGPTGIGKTCLAMLVAKVHQWQLFELNASDFRTKEVIDRVAGAASQGASFSGKPRLVLLDEVDGLQGRADRGGTAAIVRILKHPLNPVILTANDIYSDQKLLPIRSACKLLHFKKINYLSIAKCLREILEEEDAEFDPEAVTALAKNCAGDFRSALLDLQTLSLCGKIDMQAVQSLGYRERQYDVFKTIEGIFRGSSVGEIRKARFQSDVGNEMLLRWIEENIPRHFTQGKDTVAAFERLSRADVFNGRIMNRQHYGFLRYSSELMTAGVALSRQNEYHGWIHYQFPSLLRKLSSSKSARSLRTQLGKKLGKQLHSSSRAVVYSDLPYLQMLFKDKILAARLSAQFDLDEGEIAFLLASKPETKKVKKIFEEARQLRQKELSAKRKPLQPLEENSLKQFEETEGRTKHF